MARKGKCRLNKDKIALVDSAAILPIGDEEKLEEVVARFEPNSVPIKSNKAARLIHAALVVGDGTDAKRGDY